MIETEKLYYNYFSAAPFSAQILDIRTGQENTVEILLDKTIFYPEGGGQSGDRGTINGVPLLDVREKNGEIYHLVTVENAGKLTPGPAELVLDSRRRLNFTQLHSGQHLLSGILLHRLGAPTVSMHLGDENCTIDVDTFNMRSGSPPFELNEDLLAEIEEKVNDVIEENRLVTVHLCPPEDLSSFSLRKPPPKAEIAGDNVIRVVEIEGCDVIACCGTHVKSTAEIAMLRVFSAEKYKGMTRIGFLAGRRLLRDHRLLRHNAGIVSRALSIPLGETGRGVLDYLEKNSQAEKRLKALEEQIILSKAEALLHKTILLRKNADADASAGPQMVIESFADESIGEVQSIGKAAQKLSAGKLLSGGMPQTHILLVLASEQDLKFVALCSDVNFDLRPIIKNAFDAGGGRGGGGPSFFQGSFGTKEALESFLREIST